MHELSLIQNALALAKNRAREANAQHIHVIKLRIGALSGVSIDALEFAFDIARRDTPAAEARLEVERVPLICYCESCQAEFAPDDFVCECPRCHQLSANFQHGRELEVAAVEVS